MDLLAEAASQAELQQRVINLDRDSQGEIGAVHLKELFIVLNCYF